MLEQIPLKIELRKTASFDTYVAISELLTIKLHHFYQSIKTPKGEAFYIYGVSNTGKTHLLQAACRYMTQRNYQSVYLPLADKTLPLVADILSGLEQVDLICLDDVDNVLEQEDWQKGLLNLLKNSTIMESNVVISGKKPMEDFLSQELMAKMMNVMPIGLSTLNNKKDIVLAMQRHSKCIGFNLPKSVGNYLVKSFSDDIEELLSALSLLAQHSLIDKKKMTLPFVKTILSSYKEGIQSNAN